MNDKKFDKIIKSKLQITQNIPEDINSLFSNFERKIIMENKEKKKVGIFKYITAIATTLTILSGGCVFAHINGIETFISPILRNLGINSKYNDEKTDINENIFSNNVNIEILNVAIDETSLIAGYKIDINNNNIDNWIEVNGEYKINGLSIEPISKSIDKDENGVYIVYQLFDINEINLKDKNDILLDFNISNISTYTEYEDLSGSYANYNNIIKGKWNFNKTIAVTNNKKTTEYSLNGNKIYVLDNVEITADKLIVGTYTNILKIKTNKENYKGNSFEVYYRVYDENNQEIATGSEERQYDYRVYNDRISIGDIPLNQQITIQIYLKENGSRTFMNAGKITVDLSKKKMALIAEEGYKIFEGDEYSFKYNMNWENTGIATANKVGPYSRYLNSLQLAIPSTTNNEERSEISILSNKGTTLQEYVDKIKKEYLNSTENGGYTQKLEKNYNENLLYVYQIIFETTDGENVYNDVKYIFEKNKTIYEIDFFGTDIEYNNLENEIEKMVSSFT